MSILKKMIGLLDLTSLNDNDTPEVITNLCQKAHSPQGSVTAVCVYPQFVKLAKKLLKDSQVKVATVCNFPSGSDDLSATLQEIASCLDDGADEIDVVYPYHAYLAGREAFAKDFIQQCKASCQTATLKVIIESGELQDPKIIANVSRDVIAAGADFLKTSTGKVSTGATLEAAETMITAIKNAQTEKVIGFKASGGVRTTAQAQQYLNIATNIMGDSWVSADTFRFGASSLLDNLLKQQD